MEKAKYALGPSDPERHKVIEVIKAQLLNPVSRYLVELIQLDEMAAAGPDIALRHTLEFGESREHLDVFAR